MGMLRTKRQRTILCRECPVARVADTLGDSVSILILRDILVKPRRFTDLELALQGVSSRTICLKLKKLEAAGFISRHPDHRLGNRVNYRITAKGRAFEKVLNAMRLYGKRYL